MNKPDQAMVKKILGVMQDDQEYQVGSEVQSKGADDDSVFIDSAVVEFNLDRESPFELPAPVRRIAPLVEKHLRTTTTSDPWGFINDQLVVLRLEDQPSGRSGKVLLFGVKYISDLLEKLFPDTRITPSERRTLLQSLSGLSLKAAAHQDSVSYETKKTQLKAVYQKTQLNKQQTLSSFLIAHLTLEHASKHSRHRADTESDRMFFNYVDNYMGPYVRASVVQESPEKRFRVIELGDPAGLPVVCIHHLGVINFSEEEVEAFRKHRLRLICPLRHGALGPSDKKLSTVDYIEHALAGIELAGSLTGQQRPVVVSLLSGCMYAINYCKRFPDKVDKLIMLGANYRPPVEVKSVSTVKESLHGLASNYEVTLEQTVSTMLKSVDQAHSLKNVMMETHNHGEADTTTIDALFDDEHQVQAMQHRLRNSPLSIVEDLKTQAARDWSPLARISNSAAGDATQIHFIHGSEDELIPVENVKDFISQKSRMTLHVVDGAGNWIFGQYTRQTAALIREIADAV